MTTRREFIVLLSATAAVRPSNGQDRPARILYFTQSAAYRHDVIPASQDLLPPTRCSRCSKTRKIKATTSQ
jgi:uncharacterized protein